MPEIIIGCLFIILSVVAIILIIKKYSMLTVNIKYNRESAVTECMEIIKDMADVSENYGHYSEVTGKIVPERALVTPFDYPQSVYYDYKVESKIEETNTRKIPATDKTPERTVTEKTTKTNVIESKKDKTIFYLADFNGENKVWVNLDTFKNFEYETNSFTVDSSRNLLTRCGIRHSVSLAPNQTFLGYKVTVKYIPANAPAFIMGDICKKNDGYEIKAAKKQFSVFSLRNKEQVVKSLLGRRNIYLALSAFLGIIGIASLVLGII